MHDHKKKTKQNKTKQQQKTNKQTNKQTNCRKHSTHALELHFQILTHVICSLHILFIFFIHPFTRWWDKLYVYFLNITAGLLKCLIQLTLWYAWPFSCAYMQVEVKANKIFVLPIVLLKTYPGLSVQVQLSNTKLTCALVWHLTIIDMIPKDIQMDHFPVEICKSMS